MRYNLDLNDLESVKTLFSKNSFIEASAGTGKTYTIVELVVSLIKLKLCHPSNILVVTFTEKAAGEIKDRIVNRLNQIYRQDKREEIEEAEKIYVNTIHGFCNLLIQEYPFEIGARFDNLLIDDTPILEDIFFSYLRKDIFFDFEGDEYKKVFSIIGFGADNTGKKISNIIEYIKKVRYFYPLKSEKTSLSNIKALLKDENNNETILNNVVIDFIASRVIEKSDSYKKDESILTYDDMIHHVYYTLENNENFRNIIQNRFRYGFIDEFQDTDQLQLRIFKKIFIEKENNRLVIIGDPKQSIYSFRHSDIDTYFEAREVIEKNGGYIITIDKNYRSDRSVVDSYNKIFSTPDFFKTNKIEYKYITPVKDVSDINCKGFYFFRVSSDSKEEDTLEFIVNEIKALVAGKRYKIKNDNNIILPSLSDIAILASSRDDCDRIYNRLIKEGINSTVYKKSGLFQSSEAITILYILDYLTEPSNLKKLRKLFFTDFFYIECFGIFDVNEFIKSDRVKGFINLARSFKNYAYNSLYSLYNFLDVENNILKKYPLIEAQKRISNYRHILEKLESIFYKEKLTPNEMKNRLLFLIFNPSDEDFYKLEDEENKVKILTIHSSKGLEFPIVFDYGAIKKINERKDFYIYKNIDNNFEFYFDMPEDKKREMIIREYQEYRRLHYVAITRAKNCFYLPVLEPKESKNLNDEICSIAEYMFNIVDSFKECEIVMNQIESGIQIKNYTDLLIEDNLVKLNKTDFKNRWSNIYSFTSISKNEEFNIVDYIENIITDEKYDEDNYLGIEDDLIPGGIKTGLFFHELLEVLDYTTEINLDFIESKAVYYFLDKSNEEIKDIVKESKNIIDKLINLRLDPSGIRLKDIGIKDRINEVEFYFPICNDLVKGFIDLVFRSNGKYYIVDWKTNRVYSDCRKHFEDNYRLQYEIYHYSLIRYLEKEIKDFDYSKNFGGGFFIYLRRLNEDGVVYIEPDYDIYKNFNYKICNAIKNYRDDR
ncbi:MAG TPA: UvrD-helicase domain-containing protein [Spirochaetota bacterium]|nr:UvrD-helicase domain-containing protein [Spirochaetota bacterium]HOM38384.1 UvrD-helicase domain-containing protein [Spirochaetota bacterium]HPQ48398.1 UvrD-helicase domain-containing protein [Spirochaetota bacterium]